MRTPAYLTLIFLALLLAAFIGTLAYFTFNPPSITGGSAFVATKAEPPIRPVISATDPLRGNPAAPLTIVEFGDFLCAACAQMETALNNILADYAGKVNLVWKDLPNTIRHPLAQKAAEAARCAGEQGKFWEYHDLLLTQQDTVAQGFSPDVQSFDKLRTGSEGLSYFIILAKQLPLNTNQFDECLSSGATTETVTRTFNEALLLRVDATPYFFIGHQRFSGALEESRLRELLNAATL